MLLFYIRHGDPIYDPDSLTPLGKRQAEAAAKRLALYGIDEIYASTSERAYQTALPCAEILKKDIKRLDFCNESHVWGEFAGDEGDGWNWMFRHDRIRKLFMSAEVTALGDKWYEHKGFEGYKVKEGTKRVNEGVDSFIGELGYEHDRNKRIYKPIAPNDKRIALFAHQGFGLCFLASVLDIPYPVISVHFDMTHTGITVIEFTEKGGEVIPKVLTLSNDSHIYREGLPTNYDNYIRF